jgi:hypothetical protein
LDKNKSPGANMQDYTALYNIHIKHQSKFVLKNWYEKSDVVMKWGNKWKRKKIYDEMYQYLKKNTP